MGTEQAMSKISEASHDLKDRARDAAAQASHYVDSATNSVGRGMETAGETLSARATSATDGLVRAGRYLQEHDPASMGRDLTSLVRQHPTAALCIGFGVGILIGRAISR